MIEKGNQRMIERGILFAQLVVLVVQFVELNAEVVDLMGAVIFGLSPK